MNNTALAQNAAPTFDIVPKGVTVEIKDKSGANFDKLYVGAGWDMKGAPVDLDLVAACLNGGKLTKATRLVYFNDRSEPGIQLSEDNRSGAGDGDDENLILDLSKVEADVTEIAIGVAAYAGSDLAAASNFHFRIVNGQGPNDTQVFDVRMDNAASGDTVLHAATLKRAAGGWTIENVSKFYQKGNGTQSIHGFAGLFA